jgi:hypothetical protein
MIMENINCCLGPYAIYSPDFPGETGPVFVDTTKTRLISIIYHSGQCIVPPTVDAKVVHEKIINGYTARWYECPNDFGRIYTVIPTACDISISLFENGFNKIGECDASEYGVFTYCFGKSYILDTDLDKCTAEFIIDDHKFVVTGTPSNTDLFDCSNCWGNVQVFSGGGGSGSGQNALPDIPDTNVPNYPTQNVLAPTGDDTNQWNDDSIGSADLDDNSPMGCVKILEIQNNEKCDSLNNPAISSSPWGSIIVAHETRNSDGNTYISAKASPLLSNRQIIFYRYLSYGTLVNNEDQSTTNRIFEVYEDLVLGSNVPSKWPQIEDLEIGFITGPLKGESLYLIIDKSRVLDNLTGKYKWIFTFNSDGNKTIFSDSNNIYDIQWFLTAPSVSQMSINTADSVQLMSTCNWYKLSDYITPTSKIDEFLGNRIKVKGGYGNPVPAYYLNEIKMTMEFEDPSILIYWYVMKQVQTNPVNDNYFETIAEIITPSGLYGLAEYSSGQINVKLDASNTYAIGVAFDSGRGDTDNRVIVGSNNVSYMQDFGPFLLEGKFETSYIPPVNSNSSEFGQWDVSPTTGMAYNMEICLSESAPSIPETPGHNPDSEIFDCSTKTFRIASSDDGQEDNNLFAGNIITLKDWSDTFYLKEIRQKIEVQYPGQKLYFTVHQYDHASGFSCDQSQSATHTECNPLLYKEIIPSVFGSPYWYSSGTINVKLEPPASGSRRYIIGVSVRSPKVKFYKSKVKPEGGYSNIALRTFFGSVASNDYHIIGPVNRRSYIRTTSTYAFAQEFCLTKTQGGSLSSLPGSMDGHDGYIPFLPIDHIIYRTSSKTGSIFNKIRVGYPAELRGIRTIKEVIVKLNIPNATTIYFYLADSSGKILKSHPVTISEIGEQYCSSGEISWSVGSESSDIYYWVGVGYAYSSSGEIFSGICEETSSNVMWTPFGNLIGGGSSSNVPPYPVESTISIGSPALTRVYDITLRWADANGNLPLQGACCSSGGCQNLLSSECSSISGDWQGSTTNCYSFNCGSLVGACCLPDGTCVNNKTIVECENLNGIWQNGEDCGSVDCDIGACCFNNYSCLNLSSGGCSSQGGNFRGVGTSCASEECGTSACCLSDETCVDITKENCDSQSGVWRSGYTCSTTSCVQSFTGACCYNNGQCINSTEDDCLNVYQGSFQGIGISCEEIVCSKSGACCRPDSSCVFTSKTSCDQQSGRYFGDGVTCENSDCSEPHGACCFSDGTCNDIPLTNCINAGGIYWGDNTNCDDISVKCQVSTNVGACCYKDGSCWPSTENDCNESDGEFKGIGVSCDDANCNIRVLENDNVFDLPQTVFPAANPDIAVFNNNLMIDHSEISYITYQVYEDNQWNIYLRQFRRVLPDSTSPSYESPFVFSNPSYDLYPISDNINVIYDLVNLFTTDDNKWNAIFRVFLENGRQVLNCDGDINGNIELDSGQEVDSGSVWVEARYDMSICSINSAPKWSIGDRFTGGHPPVASTFGGSDTDGCTEINTYPNESRWCYQKSDCEQYGLYDSGVCPTPYISIIYNPSDMWTISTGNDLVTRVKYQMEIDTDPSTTRSSLVEPEVDFMFVVDYSISMSAKIQEIRSALPVLSQSLKQYGVNVKFGLCIFSGSNNLVPDSITCGGEIFDGLYGFNGIYGFTDNIQNISDAMSPSSWKTSDNSSAGYVAIQYALDDAHFLWRPDSGKFMLIATDTKPDEYANDCTYLNNYNSALNALSNKNCKIYIAACQSETDCIDDTSDYFDMGVASGWNSSSICPDSSHPTNCGYFYVGGPYYKVFDNIVNDIITSISKPKIVERDIPGYSATFIKPAEIIITYKNDLTDIWTYEKHKLSFIDSAPSLSGHLKGLSSMPYDIENGMIYGVDSVHLVGNTNNWVYFSGSGNVEYDYPNVGAPTRDQSNPRLIFENAKNPKIAVNNRGNVFIVCESMNSGVEHIVIKGTGDFAQQTVTGADLHRSTKFWKTSDFVFEHNITLPGEGVNQLCDLIIDKNDIIHVTWQSNRDGYWEIYYANGYDLFNPVRITKSESRSAFPSIDIDDSGNVFIVYQDNRYGPYNILLSYRSSERVVPLLQQNAYLGSVRSGYSHYITVLPILLTNLSTPVSTIGTMWGSRSTGSMSMLFGISPVTGVLGSNGGDSSYDIVAFAGKRSGEFYGITRDGTLLLLADSYEDPYLALDLTTISEIGQIVLSPDQEILDATIDEIGGSLWMLIHDSTNIIIKQVDVLSASVLRESVIYYDVDRLIGGITCTSDGKFYLSSYRDGISKLSISEYPLIGNDIIIFDFIDTVNFSVNIKCLITDYNDIVYGVSDLLGMYIVNEHGETLVNYMNNTDGDLEYIIDNRDSDNTNVIGSWKTGSAAPGKWSIDYRFKDTIDRPIGFFRWVPDLPYPGKYRVSAYFPGGGNRPIDAPFTIYHSDGSDTIRMNQKPATPTLVEPWRYLGFYSFGDEYGSGGYVELSNDTDPALGWKAVIADAVKFTPEIRIGYQFTGHTTSVGNSGFFNTILEFYTNKNLVGQPDLVIDSRVHRESFTIEQFPDDPYKPNGDGIYLKSGQSGYMFFDASNYRPDASNLSYPYVFVNNQSYFVKVIMIDQDGNSSYPAYQNSTFSCTKCSVYASGKFDLSECSYSFLVNNTGSDTRYFNFRINFYSDELKLSIVKCFYLSPGSSDIGYCEVDNTTGANEWGEFGLAIRSGESKFIQIYPSLDPAGKFICGIEYPVDILLCSSSGSEVCSNFGIDLDVIETYSKYYFCECSSAIFDNRLLHINELNRWHSSAHGYSDTRITDTPNNNYHPVISTRSSGSAVVVFEDRSSISEIKAATFSPSDSEDVFGSGTRGWFDYSTNSIGEKPALSIDMFDRANVAYEFNNAILPLSTELPRSVIDVKTCKFNDLISSGDTSEKCNISSFESNVISNDPFINAEIVKKIIVESSDVDYFTYNSSGEAVAVISKRDVVLQIWGTPEIVAVRVKNENELSYGNWCPALPEINSYFIEIQHKLSPGPGIKEVCVQAMTYNGITSEFCVPIIADYCVIDFEIKLYSDSSYSTALPKYDELYVASAISEKDLKTNSKYIYIEIIPSIDTEESNVNYDVIQQGSNDQYGLEALKVVSDDGKTVFRGKFLIFSDDGTFNKDGIARIQASIPSSCGVRSVSEGTFIKNSINTVLSESSVGPDELSQYRQPISGHIGVGVQIRPDQDPYLIFGDINYYLK